MSGDLEQLAYEASLRALDKQERLLEELRARTGVLLAGTSLATPVLGQAVSPGVEPLAGAILALPAFVVAIAAGIYVLLPRPDLVFTMSGPGVLAGLHEQRDDLTELHRRLAYDLHRFWNENDVALGRLMAGYRVAAVALMVQVVLLAASTAGSIFAA